jgi:hypothetical protein
MPASAGMPGTLADRPVPVTGGGAAQSGSVRIVGDQCCAGNAMVRPRSVPTTRPCRSGRCRSRGRWCPLHRRRASSWCTDVEEPDFEPAPFREVRVRKGNVHVGGHDARWSSTGGAGHCEQRSSDDETANQSSLDAVHVPAPCFGRRLCEMRPFSHQRGVTDRNLASAWHRHVTRRRVGLRHRRARSRRAESR